jgi:hypothetical protein
MTVAALTGTAMLCGSTLPAEGSMRFKKCALTKYPATTKTRTAIMIFTGLPIYSPLNELRI